MITSKLAKLTTFMIYTGTAMLSVLSFFTSFYGMAIFLDESLALIGSLGLQIAMLGVAWNLIRAREKRFAYVTVFAVAATFSIFFSYANFDSTLKAQTRSANARGDYTVAARPALDAYSSIAKNAALRGGYQLERLNRLVVMEREKGWSTVADEGRQDFFVQSVIDGARRTIESWEEQNGIAYPQGAGDGIISDFLESSLYQAQTAVEKIDAYAGGVDSAMLALSTVLPVSQQYSLVNSAWVGFPISEIEMLGGDVPAVPLPPEMDGFLEQATNRHEAFMLVIDDLFDMDYLAAFSLALAIAIDLIVVLMALAGSRLAEDPDYVFNRVRRHTALAITDASLSDPDAFAETLSNNIARYRQAITYRLDLAQVLADYEAACSSKKKPVVTLRRGSEERSEPWRLSLAQLRTRLADFTGSFSRILPNLSTSTEQPPTTVEPEEKEPTTPVV